MDVREVTRFKPDMMLKPAMVQEEVEDDDSFESQAAKRKLARKRAQEMARAADLERAYEEERRAKYPRLGEEGGDKLSAEHQEQIDKMMDKVEETLDDTGVKKIILAFEKKALKNQMLLDVCLKDHDSYLRENLQYEEADVMLKEDSSLYFDWI